MNVNENQAGERPEHPVDVVERLAAINEWAFDRADEDEISILVAGTWAHYEIAITWLPEIESLHVSCSFDLKIPTRRRAEIVSLVQLINEQLWLGHFDLWKREDIVMFRHAHCLAGGAQPSDAQCGTIVNAAVTACENHYQAFQFVLWAGRTAAEAMALAAFETKGNA
ncbi:MAG: YbjN domain-containing protein [Hyphomicrobiales bacterium]|nr:YbjN domain-containing protein [Hyphomicrobiales bacterium]